MLITKFYVVAQWWAHPTSNQWTANQAWVWTHQSYIVSFIREELQLSEPYCKLSQSNVFEIWYWLP